MALTGKIVEVFFEKVLETHEKQHQLLPLVEFIEPDPGDLQNAGNFIWRPVQQHAPVLDGFDLTGQEQELIEEVYPAVLGTPKNDFVKQRIDDLRTTQFWERRGEQSGIRQASELNKAIASTVATQGSLFYRSNATSGYNFIANGQAIQNERQAFNSGRCFVLHDRHNLKFGQDLAARQTLQGRPETTWATGQIGQNVAEYDVYTGSYLPTIAGGANPATTVTATVSEKPEAGTVSATGVVTNVDYRIATIPVTASASYNIGDKVTFGAVQSVGLHDKTPTGQLMTFTIVGIPDGTSVQVYPKPIAVDDPGLTATEAAYANIDTQIASGDTMDRLNIDASAKVNLFWDKSAIEVIGGKMPADLFAQYDGMKVISETMSNGQELYVVYDGKIDDLTFRMRCFTWYGVTAANPSNMGIAVTY
jgi:hypothetical protein